MIVKAEVHRQNLLEFQEFSINDKVVFYDGCEEHLGIVKDFTINCLGEIVLVVSDIYTKKERLMHPRSAYVNVRKL